MPGKSELAGKLTVGAKDKASADSALIERWRTRLPRTNAAPTATARWDKMGTNDVRTVIIDWQTTDRAADFYPYENQPSDIEGPTEIAVLAARPSLCCAKPSENAKAKPGKPRHRYRLPAQFRQSAFGGSASSDIVAVTRESFHRLPLAKGSNAHSVVSAFGL